MMFGSLRSYYKLERNSYVPTGRLEEGKKLGQWLCSQRKQVKKEIIRDDRETNWKKSVWHEIALKKNGT